MLKPFFRRVLADKQANVLAFSALALPFAISSVGLATDTIQWVLWKRELQRTADSAALAGAMTLKQVGSRSVEATTKINAAVNHDIGLTNNRGLLENPIINIGERGAYKESVHVEVKMQRRLPFSSLVMDNAPVIIAKATAAVGNPAKYCVVALEEDVTTGITAGGSTRLDLGCGMMSNSSDPNAAVNFFGNASVMANPVSAVGGVDPGKNTGLNQLEHQSPIADPFAYLPNPKSTDSGTSCTGRLSNNNNDTTYANPGCWTDWDIKGTLILSPGTYYIAGGSISSNAGAKIIGVGVTIILTNLNDAGPVATISANGQAMFDISAPKTGPYAGILIYQDPDAGSSGDNKINGGSGGALSGAIYFPKQSITLNGNADFRSNCMRLVARKVTFIGNSSVTNNCPTDSNVRDITAGGLDGIRLVE